MSQVRAGRARIFVMYFQSNFENTSYVRPENFKVFANQVKSVSGYSGIQNSFTFIISFAFFHELLMSFIIYIKYIRLLLLVYVLIFHIRWSALPHRTADGRLSFWCLSDQMPLARGSCVSNHFWFSSSASERVVWKHLAFIITAALLVRAVRALRKPAHAGVTDGPRKQCTLCPLGQSE